VGLLLAPAERHEVVPFLNSSRHERVAGSVRPRLYLLVDSDLEVRRINPPSLDARTVVAETRCGGHLARRRLLLALVVAPIKHGGFGTYTRRLWPGVIDGEA